MKRLSDIIKFVWASLKPVLVIVLVSIVIAGSLIAYDQYQNLKERRLAATLIDRVEVKADCEKIVTAGQKFDLKFEIENGSIEPIHLFSFSVDKSILGVGGKRFTDFVSSKPNSAIKARESGQFVDYEFSQTTDLEPKEKLAVALNFLATGRTEAGASPHTIVVYEGKVVFHFKPQMQIEAACQVQIRYP